MVYLALVETGKYWFYRLHRAGRFTARTLRPAGRPDPDQADRKRPARAGEPAFRVPLWTANTGPLPLPHETAPAVHSWHKELAPRDPARKPRPAEGQGRT